MFCLEANLCQFIAIVFDYKIDINWGNVHLSIFFPEKTRVDQINLKNRIFTAR